MILPGEILYEEHEEFNQSLDEERGEIIIGTEAFKPSEILYELRREAYRIAASDFLRRQFEDNKEIVYHNFPTVVAYHFRLSEKGINANNPINRLLHLKDFWEACIFFLHAIVWGEVRAKSVNLKTATVYRSGDPNLSFNTDCVFTNELKQMLENIKAVVNFSRAQGLNLKCEAISSDLLDDLHTLQTNRNDISHSQLPTREQALEQLETVNPIIKRVIKELLFLQDIVVVRFDSFNGVCRFEVFKGYAPTKDFDEIAIQATQLSYAMNNAGEQIMSIWSDEIYSLSPFIHFVPDGSGHDTYLCVFKGRRAGRFWYEPIKLRKETDFNSIQHRFNSEKAEIQALIN